MTEKSFIAHSLDDLPGIADEIIPLLSLHPVVAFYGAMGVGKTTFIKILCQRLEVTDPVTSPSFAIINEYLTARGQSIFHFDFYRLRSDEELFDLGYEDYFDNGAICLLEWPEKIANYLPEERLDILLEELPDGSRRISISLPG
jgi:tRNA threonylcarbamoyladenosine biosynthesis protein TsaE